MKLNEIGETGLIERIRKRIKIKDVDVIAGIGDDAAVLRIREDKYTLFTSDMLIEGIHFTHQVMSFFQVGQKAIAVNLSDIAAMGGMPRFCLVSLGIPSGTKSSPLDTEAIDEIYRGILSLAKEYNVQVVGGDTNSSPSSLIIDVCLIGEVEPELLCLRSKALPGDWILVTGKLGNRAAHFEKGKDLPVEPRIKEARAMLEIAKINAMIDISDGLSKDLHSVARLSNAGAIIYEEKIPVAEGANIELAINGGEDFELLLTLPEEKAKMLLKKMPGKTGTSLSHIGEILKPEKRVSIKRRNGEIVPLQAKGYEHFKK